MHPVTFSPEVVKPLLADIAKTLISPSSWSHDPIMKMAPNGFDVDKNMGRITLKKFNSSSVVDPNDSTYKMTRTVGANGASMRVRIIREAVASPYVAFQPTIWNFTSKFMLLVRVVDNNLPLYLPEWVRTFNFSSVATTFDGTQPFADFLQTMPSMIPAGVTMDSFYLRNKKLKELYLSLEKYAK